MLLGISKNRQSGAVSIFIVIFLTLLVSVVTVSFVRVMLNDQQQATNSDLSHSAYDSAQAGVEDAKRALMKYKSLCGTIPVQSGCTAAYKAAFGATQTCNSGVKTLTDLSSSSASEVKVNSGDTSDKYDQAYTCTLINLNTPDYLGQLSSDQSIIIPLSGVGAFSQVQIEWFSSKDLSTSDLSKTSLVTTAEANSGKPLLQKSDWKSNMPPIMRAQLIQFGSSFTLSNLDNPVGGTSDANTLFLYPSGVANSTAATTTNTSFINDVRRVGTKSPTVVNCKGSLTSGGYACTTIINLPNPVNGGTRTAFLRLTSLYNKANYRVTMPGTTFDGVQPEIDSTGRANNLFRRVKSRVELVDTNFPFPDAAVDITGNLCKEFKITDNTDDYAGLNSASTCTP